MTAFRHQILGTKGRSYPVRGKRAPGKVLTARGWTTQTIAAVDGLQDALDEIVASTVGVDDADEADGGFAALDADSRTTVGVNTSDDLIVSAPAGLVLQSPDGNYWRLTVNDFGELDTESLGTEPP